MYKGVFLETGLNQKTACPDEQSITILEIVSVLSNTSENACYVAIIRKQIIYSVAGCLVTEDLINKAGKCVCSSQNPPGQCHFLL